jgi:hypothetical protein
VVNVDVVSDGELVLEKLGLQGDRRERALQIVNDLRDVVPVQMRRHERTSLHVYDEIGGR